MHEGVGADEVQVVAVDRAGLGHLRGKNAGPVVLPRLQGVEAGVVVGDERPHDGVDGREVVPTPVVLVADHPDVLAGAPFGETEWAGAHELVSPVVRGVAHDLPRAHPAEDVLREHGFEEAGVIAVEAVPGEDDGVLVGHGAVDDAQVLVAVVDLRARSGHEAPGEADVLAGERLAVVPSHAFLERPGHGDRPVVVHLDQPVLLGGDGLGKYRDVGVLVVGGDQPFHHAELDVRQILAGKGVEDVDLPIIGQPEDVALGAAPGGGRAGLAAVPSTGGEPGSGDQEYWDP